MENLHLPIRGKVSKEVLCQEIEGETVLLNLANEEYYGLDETGTRFWQLLSEFGDSTRVLASLQTEFNVDKETLEKDLSALIQDLINHGLFVAEH